MKSVIVIGTGGHAKVIADIIRLSGDKIVGYLDDKSPDKLTGYHVIGTTRDIGKWECYYFVAIGDCVTRNRLMTQKVKWYTAIHPSSVIASDASIGDGVCVMANAVINSEASIGKGVIINTAATVDHDCIIGDYTHVAPGVHISGAVKIGNETWIGVGSVINNNISICSECMIGAGTVIVKDIKQKGTYVGVPAKLLK